MHVLRSIAPPMPLAARRQTETRPAEILQADSLSLPPAEHAEVVDRRGPMRPGALVPTRARLQGQVVALSFQAVDALVLVGVACGLGLGTAPGHGVIIGLVCSLSVLTALSLARS